MARWPSWESWKTPACFFMISARTLPPPVHHSHPHAHHDTLLNASYRTVLKDRSRIRCCLSFYLQTARLATLCHLFGPEVHILDRICQNALRAVKYP